MLGTALLARRMVRVLVATALREAVLIQSSSEQESLSCEQQEEAQQALLRLCAGGDRVRTAPAAPAAGLAFVGAAYGAEAGGAARA